MQVTARKSDSAPLQRPYNHFFANGYDQEGTLMTLLLDREVESNAVCSSHA